MAVIKSCCTGNDAACGMGFRGVQGFSRRVDGSLFVIPPTPDGSWLWLCDNCKSRCAEYPIQIIEWHNLLLLISVEASFW